MCIRDSLHGGQHIDCACRSAQYRVCGLSLIHILQEYLENLGYNCTWETIYWGVPWATALENRKAEMESLLAATGEIIEASNSPKVEDFEAIPDGGITTPIVSKLTAVPGGSSGYELYLDTEVKNSGNYGGKMYYDVSDVGWGGFRKEFTRDWSEYNAMSLWVQGDGTKQLLTLTSVSYTHLWGAGVCQPHRYQLDNVPARRARRGDPFGAVHLYFPPVFPGPSQGA